MSAVILIPKRIIEEVEKRGVDVRELVLNILAERLQLDPNVVLEARLELAEGYLEEGEKLVDKDPVQASEKLYKAAEEAVKALATMFNLRDVIERVKRRGRWTVTDLEKAVQMLSKRLGDWVIASWGEANYLHVWGFHEARLDAEAVKLRIPFIKKLVEEVEKIAKKRK